MQCLEKYKTCEKETIMNIISSIINTHLSLMFWSNNVWSCEKVDDLIIVFSDFLIQVKSKMLIFSKFGAQNYCRK